MNRIWIVGANGRIGSSLTKILNTVENELFCTDISEVDITDFESVQAYAVMYRPNIIINCASISNVSECSDNPDEAYNVNALGARNLAVHAHRIDAKFVQLSTDDVFSGNGNGLYNEFDIPDAVTVYGKSKLAGEHLISQMITKMFIIRSSWVYGIGEDFVDYVCRALDNNEKIEVNVNHIAVPTHADEVAQIISKLIKTEEYGIYHVVPEGSCSRYEFAKKIAEYKGCSDELIIPYEGPSINTQLDDMMLRINKIEPLNDWQIELQTYINETGGMI